MVRFKLFGFAFFLILCLCACGSTISESAEKDRESGSGEISRLTDPEAPVLTDGAETTTETDTAEENSPARTLTAKGSNGSYRYTFGDTEVVLSEADEENDPFAVSEGDRIGSLRVEHIIAYETQQQLCFSGEIVLSGLLYRESGSSDVFSDRMDPGWLLFFPDPSGFPVGFPILCEEVGFEDKNAACSLSASTEPLLLIGAFNDDVEELFRERDYIWAEIRVADLQLRNGLDWLLIPYESTAGSFEILSANSLEKLTKQKNENMSTS